MKIFDFLSKKSKPKSSSNNILLAMPMFNNGNTYQVRNILENLKSQWGFEISDFAGDNEAASFQINSETIGLVFLDVPIPWGDIEGTAKYAYNWSKALPELENHTGHAIISLMGGTQNSLDRFEILSKILYSLLITSEAVGIYQGSQSLLIPRKQYLSIMDSLKSGDIPVNLWVYIGINKTENGNNAYTYGLKDFQKQEIEIIDSKLSLEELFDFLYNISSYIIGNDVILKPSETIGLSAEQKIPIISSKGQFVEGESIKLKL